MSVFESVAGVPVEETTTEAGDWSFMWARDDVELEAVYVRGRARWVLGTQPTEGGGSTVGDLDPERWPAVRSRDEARALVALRVGCDR